MMSNKNPRTATIHEKEIIINKEKLKTILEEKGYDFQTFHKKISDDFGLDLQYKGFMTLLSNRSTWKLLYAHAIATSLRIDYMEIFELVDIDVEKAKRARVKWKEKYQK